MWAEKIATTNSDNALSITFDAEGNVYVEGELYSSTLIFNNGKAQFL